MTNEELQTLIRNACKAAGWRIKRIASDFSGAIIWVDDTPILFHPATNDGDSRMLQVACRIALEFEFIGGDWSTAAYIRDKYGRTKFCTIERLQDDASKAARMAVLRCAGMIGEAME